MQSFLAEISLLACPNGETDVKQRFGLGIFTVASLLCALAPDATFLNLSRAPCRESARR